MADTLKGKTKEVAAIDSRVDCGFHGKRRDAVEGGRIRISCVKEAKLHTNISVARKKNDSRFRPISARSQLENKVSARVDTPSHPRKSFYQQRSHPG